MKIVFAGGGTLGPVTPLLAVCARLKELDPTLGIIWYGTPDGPERALMASRRISYVAIPVAKWPRHWSWERVLFPLRYLQALRLVRRMLKLHQPDVIVTAGGFTATPVVRVASRMGIACVTHQLDRLPGLANRFLADRCVRVTTSFAYARPPFGSRVETMQIATPVQFSLADLPARSQALRQLGLATDKPTILVMGGGTGAAALNAFVQRNWQAWRDRGWQVMHICGTGKQGEPITDSAVVQKVFCLPEEMRMLFAQADDFSADAGVSSRDERSAVCRGRSRGCVVSG